MSVQEPTRMQQPGGDATDSTLLGKRWLGRRMLVWLPVGLALLFYLPLLLGLRTFPHGDFTHHFLPFSLFQHAALRGGYLPVWNPFTYSGHPFLADIQAAVFYPISNLILLATLPIGEAAARLYLLQVEAVVHVALAGIFCGLLARRLTGSDLAGLVAGVCFAFSGYLTGYAPLQLAVLRTAVWLPLILWCVLEAWATQRLLWWIGAAIALAVAFLGGHPQTFLYVLYALAAWIVLLAVHSRRQSAQTLHGLWGASAMLLFAGGLSAAQWLPSLEFLRLSVRADVGYGYVSGGFPLQDTWQLLLPGVLTQYSPLSIGVGGLQLAFCALIWAWRADSLPGPTPGRGHLPWRTGVGFFAGVALFGLLAAYGENGLLYPLLYRIAPGWKLFRGQERAAYLVAMGLAVLAGYGAALLPAAAGVWRRRAALISGALTVAGVYAFGLLWQMMGRSAIGNGRYLVIAALTLLVGMAVALLVWLPGWSQRRSRILLALAAAPLFAANLGANLDAATPAQKVTHSPEILAVQQAVAANHTAGQLAGRVYNEYRVYDDYGMAAGVEDVWGSSPLRLARYARLFEEFPLDRMWRLLGVEHVLTWRRELFGPSDLLAEFPQAGDTTYLHRLPDAGPRAWFVDEVRVVDDAAAWLALADHQVHLDAVALVADEIHPDPTSSARTVSVTRPAHHRLRIAAGPGAAAFLVVAENWMPGWRVRDVVCTEGGACASGQDGLLQPVRADLTLVGVPVPAGAVTFDLVYAPESVRFGLWISGVTLGLLAVVVAWAVLRRRDAAT